MAGTIGTNVTVDGSTEFQILQMVLSDLEQAQSRRERSLKDKLALRMTEYLMQENGTPVHNLIPRKYAADLEAKLQYNAIPYVRIDNPVGDALFVCRTEDSKAFMREQKSVFGMYGNEVKESSLLISCNNAQTKEAICLKTKTRENFSILQAKLENAGINCAISGERDDMNVVISPYFLFNEDPSQGLIPFELEWAMTQSLGDSMFDKGDGAYTMDELRTLQAAYDEAQIDAVFDSENAILTDVNNASNFYLEKRGELLMLYGRDENGEWTLSQKTSIKEKDAFHAILRSTASKINNMYAYTGEETTAGREQTKLNPALAALKHPEGFRNGRGKLTEDMLSEKNKAVKIMCRQEILPVLTAINHQAIENVKARYTKSQWNVMNTPSKYNLVKKEVQKLLQPKNAKKTSAYEKFLTEISAKVSLEEKREMFENIAHHFIEEHETGKGELEIERINAKQRLDEIERKAKNTLQKENTQEKENEEKDRGDKE